MRSPNHVVRTRAAVLVLAGALAWSGCASTADEPSTPMAGESPTISSAPTPTVTPVATPSPSEPTATPTGPLTLTDRLLPTDQVPGLNAQWHWEDGRTGPAGTEPFGLCQKVDLLSIGATEVVERTYFPPVDTDDNAAEQIAEFPDTATAARVEKVLHSWRGRCGKKAGSLTAVPVGTGKASWYLVSVRSVGAEEARFHAFGIVRSGTRIAVLRIDNGGQDYNYPAGAEPMVAMVRAAAERLAS